MIAQTQQIRIAPRAKRKPQLWGLYLAMVLLTFVNLAPFAWLISSSLKDKVQYQSVPPVLLPVPAHPDNYLRVFTEYGFGNYVWNSVWIAIISVILVMMSSALVAYGFARFRFPGRNFLFVVLLATLMMPQQILTIPLYSLFKSLGWLNSFLPILVPKLFGSAFNIFLLRQFFLTLPKEIDEAARIDGCGTLRIFWHIILPQSIPALAAVAVFEFLASWRDVWSPLIYLSSQEYRTLPLGLLYFIGPLVQDYPALMAAIVISLLLPVALYAVGQKYIDDGVAIAELK
jgi:multiple sugar transport system permease protein